MKRNMFTPIVILGSGPSLDITTIIPAGNYMFKGKSRNTRIRCKICSKLTIKTPERRLVKKNITLPHMNGLSSKH